MYNQCKTMSFRPSIRLFFKISIGVRMMRLCFSSKIYLSGAGVNFFLGKWDNECILRMLSMSRD